MMLKMPRVPRPRITFTRQMLIKGLKGLEFLIGLVIVHIGLFGLAATTYGMLVFQQMNLGGVMLQNLVDPVSGYGINGIIVAAGIIAVGLLLMRRILLIPPRYISRKFLKGRVHAPRGIFGSPGA